MEHQRAIPTDKQNKFANENRLQIYNVSTRTGENVIIIRIFHFCSWNLATDHSHSFKGSPEFSTDGRSDFGNQINKIRNGSSSKSCASRSLHQSASSSNHCLPVLVIDLYSTITIFVSKNKGNIKDLGLSLNTRGIFCAILQLTSMKWEHRSVRSSFGPVIDEDFNYDIVLNTLEDDISTWQFFSFLSREIDAKKELMGSKGRSFMPTQWKI